MGAIKIKKLLEQNSTTTRRATEKEKGRVGLLISKRFIEKNRGTLSIQSDQAKRSGFLFTLLLHSNGQVEENKDAGIRAAGSTAPTSIEIPTSMPD